MMNNIGNNEMIQFGINYIILILNAFYSHTIGGHFSLKIPILVKSIQIKIIFEG